MGTEKFGDYAAYTTPGGVRFQHLGKLVPRAAVPVEVAAYLDVKLAGPDRGSVPVVKSARPRITPEESARLKAETIAVKPELQMSQEEIVEKTLLPEDFDTPEAPAIEDVQRELAYTKGNEEYLAEEWNKSQAEIENLKKQPGPASIDTDFLESISIHTASIYDIAEALYNRFGLYTVYLRRLPVADETNPLTGENFTNYHLGIAYQAAIRAQNQGTLERDPRLNREQLDEGRAAVEHFQEQFVPQERTMGEARKNSSFAYRTSVRGANESSDGRSIVNQKFDDGEDEMLVEPRFGKQIIDPNWAD